MIPHEARYLYDWTGTSKLSYGDFLRAKQFEHSIRYAIDSQTKQLIASNEQLVERGIEVLGEDIAHGFCELSEDLRALSSVVQEGMADIERSIHWGFSEVLISLGQMNISLAELVRLISTPSQTWACEQFEIARDEFRRELYPEALQSVTHAIEGFGSNPGVKTQFRFHFLVGTIRLGSYKNSSAGLVNPDLAEQAFLSSARYARVDYPDEAGHSLICAGRAAFVQANIDRAIDHTRNGLALVPRHAEGIYQLGRALFHKGSTAEAIRLVVDAVSLDAHYAIRVSGDPDFHANPTFVNTVLTQARSVYLERYREAAARFQQGMDVLGKLSSEVSAHLHTLRNGREIAYALESAQSAAATSTIFGYSSAIDGLEHAYALFPTCFDDYRSHYAAARREELSRRTGPSNIEKENGLAFLSVVAWIVAIPVAIVLFFVIGTSKAPGPSLVTELSDGRVSVRSVPFGEGLGLALFLFGTPIVVAAGIIGGAELLQSMHRERIRSHNAAMQYEYTVWRSRLERDIATAHQMELPEECKSLRTRQAITALRSSMA